MTLLAIPLCFLYFASGILSLLIDKKRSRVPNKQAEVSPIDKPERI
jgi:sec-independent protein translocase protein TatC